MLWCRAAGHINFRGGLLKGKAMCYRVPKFLLQNGAENIFRVFSIDLRLNMP
jgi:hypothetical protein